MKLHYFLGALILASIGNLAIISTSFASESPEVSSLATINKPSREAIAAAIAKVENIGDYKTHFSATARPLDSDVEFYREYNYLLGLVTTAENLLANYDQASASDLEMIIAAANDAEIACNLLFGTNRQTKTASIVVAATPVASATTAQATSAPTPANNTATSTPIKNTVSKPEVTQLDEDDESNSSTTAGTLTISVNVLEPTSAPEVATEESDNITTSTETSNTTDTPTALAYTATATVTGCALGTLYLKERRTYRPGRR